MPAWLTVHPNLAKLRFKRFMRSILNFSLSSRVILSSISWLSISVQKFSLSMSSEDMLIADLLCRCVVEVALEVALEVVLEVVLEGVV